MASLRSKLCHEKDFVLLMLRETCDDSDELVCLACGDLVIGGPIYILIRRDRDPDYLHKSCVELPCLIRHPLHPRHPLIVSDHPHSFICDGCRHVSFGYQYRCSKECRFKLDIQCVSKNEGQALKKRVEKHTIYHRHKLQLVYFRLRIPTRFSEDLRCCCCLKSCPDGGDPTYSCNVCFKSENPFLIHKSCLDTIPRRQVQSSFHPEHPLFIKHVRGDFESRCSLCNYWITGLSLTCHEGDEEFHVSCGSRTARGLRLNLHKHDMYYVILRSRLQSCTICEAECQGAYYRCVKCDVNVHIECIPLPEIVEHESHEYHPLKLTDSVVTYRDDDEYRCDICEEEGNIKHHSYYCNECNYIAHIDCVLSEHQDTSPKISCLDPRRKGKAEKETDDAEEKTKDEGHGMYSSSQEYSDSEDFYDGQQYHESTVDDRIEKFRTKIEELASELETVANLDKRIEKVRVDMVKLVFQFDDLTKKFIKSRN